MLVFSEGRGINPCYEVLGLPKERILQEYGPVQTKQEQIDRLSLYIELLDRSAQGEDVSGADPSGKPVNVKWFMERANKEGFKPMLDAIPGGADSYTRLVTYAILHKAEQYNDALVAFLNLILEHFLTAPEDAPLRDIITTIRDAPLAGRRPQLKGIYRNLRELRDESIIRRISERVATEPAVEIVFLIIGAAHYENMVRLIGESPNLRLSALSNATYGGRRKSRGRRHSRRRRLTRRK